jgi:HEXXH motif-containing protein
MPTAPDIDPASLLPPFDVSLPIALRVSGESALFASHSLIRENYSTQRFLYDFTGDNPAILKAVPMASGNVLLCETPSPGLLRYCAEHDLRLATDADAYRATDLIEAALLTVIEPFPSLWSAVSELAWRCHPLLASDRHYDVSFSDPAIPFSVFVSAPPLCDRNSILRVAESLVHETMHLQLTLFEGLSPLVDAASNWSMYSPWKQQERSAQGILHGLYVFCVLGWMWRQVSETSRYSTERDFALRRISEIDDEVAAVRSFEESPALTEEGRHFLHQLFAL